MSEAARTAFGESREAEQDSARSAGTSADAGFLWDFWYPALRSSQIRGRNLATAMLLEVPLVLGRTSDGRAFAMRDACPHRGIPLPLARLTGRAWNGTSPGCPSAAG